jgi:hypothetical protein
MNCIAHVKALVSTEQLEPHLEFGHCYIVNPTQSHDRPRFVDSL